MLTSADFQLNFLKLTVIDSVLVIDQSTCTAGVNLYWFFLLIIIIIAPWQLWQYCFCTQPIPPAPPPCGIQIHSHWTRNWSQWHHFTFFIQTLLGFFSLACSMWTYKASQEQVLLQIRKNTFTNTKKYFIKRWNQNRGTIINLSQNYPSLCNLCVRLFSSCTQNL